jgi:hypothetical protein
VEEDARLLPALRLRRFDGDARRLGVRGSTGTVGLSGAAAALPFSVHTSLVAGSCANA